MNARTDTVENTSLRAHLSNRRIHMSKNRQARRAAAAKQKQRSRSESRPARLMQSPSRGRLAANWTDGYRPLRDALFTIANGSSEWAGIPMPLDGQRLVIEPTYPMAEKLMNIGSAPSADDDGWRLRNSWYSLHHRCDILIMEREGKVDWGKVPAFHHITHDINTLGCMDAWGLEQETNAVQLLSEMVSARQLKQYILTGMFLEKSKRSGVTYMFRRLKPTVALAASPDRVPRDGVTAVILGRGSDWIRLPRRAN